MNTKDFMNKLTPQAIKYIASITKTDNQESYKKLKAIFDDQTIELKSFEDTYLDITSFNWSGIERDRNWWWQLQSFPFLNWYIDSYGLQNKEEKSTYFLFCIEAIDNWIAKTKNNDSPLAWHDHATAFRIRNIINWLVFCYIQEIEVIEPSDSIDLPSLIFKHFEWLLDDQNYSKYTNHGFDQAMIILTIGAMFDAERLETQRLISRQRLKEEIEFAFTDEGVHKENSPGYQKFMLGRLKQLRTLESLGEQNITQIAESYIEKAEIFLVAITLPDGSLPMIGDTKGFELGILGKDIVQESYKVFDYSKSGYVIVKGNSEKVGDFYFLLKNCHNSNYHRHDDDLMIYLWCNGETVLGDGGLYSHNEKSKIRKFIRSSLAHSVPFSSGIIERDNSKLEKLPELFFDKKKKLIVGKSYATGSKISRTVNIENISQGIIEIYDEVQSLPLFINYFFSENSSIKVLKRYEAIINIGTVYCKINFPSTRSINLYKGTNEDFRETSLLSKDYGESLESMRILLSSSNTISKMTVEVGINK